MSVHFFTSNVFVTLAGRPLRQNSALLAALVLCAQVVACGGSDDEAEGSADTSATDAQTDIDTSLPDTGSEDAPSADADDVINDVSTDAAEPDTDDTQQEDATDVTPEPDSDTEVAPDAEPDVPEGPVPTITELIPTCGPNDGSRRIVILGENFRDPIEVTFGEETIDGIVEGPGVVVQPAPVAPFEGFVPVSVTAGGVPSETLDDAYWYHRGVTWTTSNLTPPSDFTFMAAVGDFDDDGKDDVVASGGSSVVLFSEFADGAFGSREINTVCASSSAVAVGDVTGDGVDDIVVGCLNSLQVLEGTAGGAPTTGPVSSFESGAAGYHLDVSLADLDGDGDLDAVVRTQSSNTVAILVNSGTGTFSDSPAPVDLGEDLTNVWAKDVTGDGRADLVSTHYNPGLVKVHVGLAGNGFAEPVSVSVPTVQELAFGDFDLDGVLDIVVSSDSAGPGTVIYTMPATDELTLLRSISEFTSFAPGAADFDASGEPDVVVGGGTGLRTFLSGPPSTLECNIEFAQAAYPLELYTGDFNGDAVPDILTIPLGAGILQLNITSISDL